MGPRKVQLSALGMSKRTFGISSHDFEEAPQLPGKAVEESFPSEELLFTVSYSRAPLNLSNVSVWSL